MLLKRLLDDMAEVAGSSDSEDQIVAETKTLFE